MVESTEIKHLIKPPLTLHINSFSYKRGLPADLTGNGGGYIFDCRGLPNPGRYSKYRDMTGKDPEVMEYISQYEEVDDFIGHCFALIKQSAESYIARNFTNLSVSFGCTGGRHRSVYCAEKIASLFDGNTDIQLNIRHLEQD
jgi:RNase adaptor protein for sRNA GlmZ degradation